MDYRITLSHCPKMCGWSRKPPAERDHEEQQQQKNTKRSQKREMPHPRGQRRQRAPPKAPHDDVATSTSTLPRRQSLEKHKGVEEHPPAKAIQ